MPEGRIQYGKKERRETNNTTAQRRVYINHGHDGHGTKRGVLYDIRYSTCITTHLDDAGHNGLLRPARRPRDRLDEGNRNSNETSPVQFICYALCCDLFCLCVVGGNGWGAWTAIVQR